MQCKGCLKTFTQRSNLSRHQNGNKNSKPCVEYAKLVASGNITNNRVSVESLVNRLEALCVKPATAVPYHESKYPPEWMTTDDCLALFKRIKINSRVYSTFLRAFHFDTEKHPEYCSIVMKNRAVNIVSLWTSHGNWTQEPLLDWAYAFACRVNTMLSEIVPEGDESGLQKLEQLTSSQAMDSETEFKKSTAYMNLKSVVTDKSLLLKVRSKSKSKSK